MAIDDERQHGERDQRQLPVHAQHDGQDAGEDEDVFENRHHARGKHFVEGVDVGGDAGDQAADRILVEKRNMQALQMAENLAAQIEHYFLAGPLHVVGLQILEQEAEDEQANIDPCDLRDASERLRARVTPEAGVCSPWTGAR